MKRQNTSWPRSIRSALLRGILLSSIAPGFPALAAEPVDPLIADTEDWVRGTSLYLEVSLNRVATGRIAHFDLRDGALYVRPSTLRELGFVLDANAVEPMRLSDLPDVAIDYDAERQRIALTAPLRLLALATSHLNAPAVENPHATSSTGAVLDYDVYATAGNASSSLAATSDLRAFAGGAGVFDTTSITRGVRASGGTWRGDSARLDTSWQLAFPESMLRLRVGDDVTDALDWTRATRIGGISIGTDFGLQPYRVITPLPAFFGAATLPSAVDLYIDGIKQYSGQVAPGPFQLTTIPTINGAGSAQIVITDALGRSNTLDLSLYASRQLLQHGLADWSFNLGYVRENYGLASFDYGRDPIASGSVRYGVSDGFTLEAHGEGTDGLALAGIGGVWLLGERGGIVSGSVARSDARGDGASQVSLGYNWANRRFAFSVDTSRAQRGYRDVAALYGQAPPRASDRASVSYASSSAGTLGANYLRQDYAGEPSTRYAGLFWSNSYGGRLSLNIGLNQNLETSRDRSLFASVTLSRENHTNYSTSLQHNRDSTAIAAQASRPVPGDGGFGWRAAVQASDAQDGNGGLAQADWIGNQGALSVGVSALGDSRYAYGDASGAVALLGGHLFPSRRIDDAFAVVSTDGIANVPVELENRPIGVTDGHGMLLVARLNAYQRNRLAIDPMSLPANMRVDSVSTDVTPSDRAGTFVRFGMQPQRSASIVLVDENHAPIALGSGVRIDGRADDGTLVGFDGVVYLDTLEATQIAHIATPGGACSVRIDYPDSTGAAIAQIGPLVCRKETP